MTTNLPTPLDNLHALMYAADKILQEKCNDPVIQAKYGNGIEWKVDNTRRIYPCLTGTCDSGRCHIITEDLCNTQSQLPWDPTTGQPIAQCSTGPTGSSDTNCVSQPYLEWNTINPTGPICTFGNYPLRKWCEIPWTRRPSSEKGVTDVPPFKYDPNKAICLETDQYCKWMEVDFHPEYNYPDTLPTCYVPAGQKFFEQWVTGKTIFRGIKKYESDCIIGTPGCYRSETTEPDGADGKEKFEKPPDIITKLCDDMYIKKKTLVGKNFAGPNVNLYSIEWREKALELDPTLRPGTAGFIGSELSKAYPELIIKKNNIKFYRITKEQARQNKNFKRIYFTSFSSSWILNNISGMIKRLQNLRKK